MAEAGTGVGKSFAYLVPAILAVAQPTAADGKPARKRVVISTHTISLQEQLLFKDIPFLNSVIPLEFSAALVKGRGNYLSLRCMNSAVERGGSLFRLDEEFAELRKLTAWSKKTHDGSLADLEHKPLPSVWEETQSDSGNCLGRQCPTYKDCFYYQARRRMQNAQVLVVNHALFFSDLALRREGANLLPDYDIAIFDEAHTLEAVASDHLGASVTSGQVEYLLNKLYNDRTNRGLLVHHKLGELQKDVLTCHMRAEEFFDDVLEWARKTGKTTPRVSHPDIVANGLTPALTALANRLRQTATKFTDDEKQNFTSAADRLTTLAFACEAWRTQRQEDAVHWIDIAQSRRGRTRVELAAAPLDVGPALRAELFERVPTVIMTSATLAVGQGSFDYFKHRVGLSAGEARQWGSPFNYREQAELVLLDDMPDPTSEPRVYERRVIEMIERYAGQSDGHAFVLLTSYDMMKRVAAGISPWLAERNLALYNQADGLSRSLMVERFKANPRGVLLGADSFWQGVDVPGSARADRDYRPAAI